MPPEHSDTTVTTGAEFEAALTTAVQAATDGNVEVRGAWEISPPDSSTTWEVQISELARDREADAD